MPEEVLPRRPPARDLVVRARELAEGHSVCGPVLLLHARRRRAFLGAECWRDVHVHACTPRVPVPRAHLANEQRPTEDRP